MKDLQGLQDIPIATEKNKYDLIDFMQFPYRSIRKHANAINKKHMCNINNTPKMVTSRHLKYLVVVMIQLSPYIIRRNKSDASGKPYLIPQLGLKNEEAYPLIKAT